MIYPNPISLSPEYGFRMKSDVKQNSSISLFVLHLTSHGWVQL